MPLAKRFLQEDVSLFVTGVFLAACFPCLSRDNKGASDSCYDETPAFGFPLKRPNTGLANVVIVSLSAFRAELFF